jgi:hypothetical protein
VSSTQQFGTNDIANEKLFVTVHRKLFSPGSVHEMHCFLSFVAMNEYVVYLNNLSIACFQHGYLDCAMETLSLAVTELLLFDDDVHRAFPENVSSANPHATQNQIQQKPLCAKFMNWVKICDPVYFRENEYRNEASLYNYALMLSAKPHDWKNGFSHCAVRAALEYNLAFIYHWRSSNSGSVSSDLHTALRHYESAWSSIQRMNEGAGMEHLALAVLNNMAYIHHQLMQFNNARLCVGVMRLLLSTRVSSLLRLKSLNDYQTFVMSAMLPPTDLKLAPAA